MRRRVLAARGDLVDRLGEIVRQKGLTLYSYVNRLIESAIRAESLGLPLERIIDEYVAHLSAKTAGMMLTPADGLSTADLDRWRGAGERLAVLMSIRGLTGWRAIESMVYALLEGVAKVTTQVADGRKRIMVLGQALTREVSKAYASLIESAAKNLGVDVSVRTSQGYLIVEGLKEDQGLQAIEAW